MKTLRYTIAFLSCLYASNFEAQQTQLTSLYHHNYVIVNPAQTGFNQTTDFSLGYRQQWTGQDGAPSTAILSGHSALNKKMGIGGYVVYDQLSFVKNLEAKLSYAYHLKLAKDFRLSFGLNAGILQNSLDFGSIITDDYTDEIISNGNVSGISFDAVFGTVIQFKDLNVGVSLPQIISPSVAIPTTTIATDYNLRPHLNVYANYKYEANEVVDITPSVFYRRSNASSQFDVLANFVFNSNLFLGVGYRQQAGLLFNLGAKIKNKFQVNYAYEFGNIGYAANTGGSHEIMLKFVIGKDFPDAAEPVDSDEPRTIQNKF